MFRSEFEQVRASGRASESERVRAQREAARGIRTVIATFFSLFAATIVVAELQRFTELYSTRTYNSSRV